MGATGSNAVTVGFESEQSTNVGDVLIYETPFFYLIIYTVALPTAFCIAQFLSHNSNATIEYFSSLLILAHNVWDWLFIKHSFCIQNHTMTDHAATLIALAPLCVC